ncbi:MAG: hypothetical protein ACOCXH_04535 [Cyclobacteriaceae bacterium]
MAKIKIYSSFDQLKHSSKNQDIADSDALWRTLDLLDTFHAMKNERIKDQHLNDILVAICQALNDNGVEYLICGGIAVGFYGYQRQSGGLQGKPHLDYDVDIWYKPTNANFFAILKALKALGHDTSRLDEVVFDKKRTYLKIEIKNFNLDFLPQMVGLDNFNHSHKNRTNVLLDKIEIPLISYEDLVSNKNLLNRDIDKKDIEQLQNNRRKK